MIKNMKLLKIQSLKKIQSSIIRRFDQAKKEKELELEENNKIKEMINPQPSTENKNQK